MIKPDRAVILAAGLGTRLHWLTANQPKALMPVAGKPAIIHTLRHLVDFGVRHVAINLHYHGEQIAQLLGDGRQFGLSIRYSRETELLDSGGGVRRACTQLPEGESLIVCNTDVVAAISFQQLWQQMQHHHAKAVLALVANPSYHPEGDFTLNDGKVELRCQGKSAWTYAGISLWSQSTITSDDGRDCFSLVEPMRALIKKKQLHGVIHHDKWCDIGRPKELLSVATNAAIPNMGFVRM